jgi:hypothetical protein
LEQENAMTPQCEPPEEWRNHRQHLLRRGIEEPPALFWWDDDGYWRIWNGTRFKAPEVMAINGWCYVGPVPLGEALLKAAELVRNMGKT